MVDYKEMYFTLFRAIASAIKKADELKAVLEKTTAETEEMYVSAGDAPDTKKD
jgi:hypothetical protein